MSPSASSPFKTPTRSGSSSPQQSSSPMMEQIIAEARSNTTVTKSRFFKSVSSLSSPITPMRDPCYLPALHKAQSNTTLSTVDAAQEETPAEVPTLIKANSTGLLFSQEPRQLTLGLKRKRPQEIPESRAKCEQKCDLIDASRLDNLSYESFGFK